MSNYPDTLELEELRSFQADGQLESINLDEIQSENAHLINQNNFLRQQLRLLKENADLRTAKVIAELLSWLECLKASKPHADASTLTVYDEDRRESIVLPPQQSYGTNMATATSSIHSPSSPYGRMNIEVDVFSTSAKRKKSPTRSPKVTVGYDRGIIPQGVVYPDFVQIPKDGKQRNKLGGKFIQMPDNDSSKVNKVHSMEYSQKTQGQGWQSTVAPRYQPGVFKHSRSLYQDKKKQFQEMPRQLSQQSFFSGYSPGVSNDSMQTHRQQQDMVQLGNQTMTSYSVLPPRNAGGSKTHNNGNNNSEENGPYVAEHNMYARRKSSVLIEQHQSEVTVDNLRHGSSWTKQTENDVFQPPLTSTLVDSNVPDNERRRRKKEKRKRKKEKQAPRCHSPYSTGDDFQPLNAEENSPHDPPNIQAFAPIDAANGVVYPAPDDSPQYETGFLPSYQTEETGKSAVRQFSTSEENYVEDKPRPRRGKKGQSPQPSASKELQPKKKSTKSAEKRVIGEIAFQLDRRILSYVFIGPEKMGKNKRRFYGYTVNNIPDMIHLEAFDLETARLDIQKQTLMLQRHREVMDTLYPLGYRIPNHADFATRIVNKYGLLNVTPEKYSNATTDLENPHHLESMICNVTPCCEKSDMLILLRCLTFLAHQDGRSLFMW